MGFHRGGALMTPQRHSVPFGCPQIELPAPPIVFPLPAVPSAFAKPPSWPPSTDEGNPYRGAAEQTSKIVDVLLDRKGSGAPMLLRDAFSTLFSKLDRPSDNANLDLIAEVLDLRTRITERLESQRSESLSTAKAEHAAMFARCRVALNERNRLVIELNGATSYAQAIQFEPLAAAQSALANAEGSKPRREDFPTPEELSTWWGSVTDARAKLDAVNARYLTQMNVVTDLTKQLQTAEAEFQRLSRKEQDLAARAENRPHHNELGVEQPAPLQEL